MYGNMNDGNNAISEIERICDWLMDPVACPTKWQVLLTMRANNPSYQPHGAGRRAENNDDE